MWFHLIIVFECSLFVKLLFARCLDWPDPYFLRSVSPSPVPDRLFFEFYQYGLVFDVSSTLILEDVLPGLGVRNSPLSPAAQFPIFPHSFQVPRFLFHWSSFTTQSFGLALIRAQLIGPPLVPSLQLLSVQGSSWSLCLRFRFHSFLFLDSCPRYFCVYYCFFLCLIPFIF